MPQKRSRSQHILSHEDLGMMEALEVIPDLRDG